MRLIRLFQVTLGLALPPTGNAEACPGTPFGTIESDVRSRCRATAIACRNALFDRLREYDTRFGYNGKPTRVWRPVELQHPRAAQHVLSKAVDRLAVGVLAHLLAVSDDCRPIETPPHHIDEAFGHCILDRRRVGNTAVDKVGKLSWITSDVVRVAAELQLVSGVLVHHEGARSNDGTIRVLDPIRVVELLIDNRRRR